MRDGVPTAPSMSRPYRQSLSAAVGAALLAGLVIALVDVVLALGRGGPEGARGELLLLVVALYALPSLGAGLALGVVAGAWRATFGEGSIGRTQRRLRDDRALDGRVAAALLAAGVATLAFILFTSVAAQVLVAGVQRQSTGALLLGAVVAAALPGFALLGLVAYRVLRPVGRAIPPVGPAPASLVLVVLAAVGAVALVLLVVFGRLDWRALDLGRFALAGGFLALMGIFLLLAGGPLAGAVGRLPQRSALVAGAALVALVLPLAALRGAPSQPADVNLNEHTSGARTLVGIGRALIDRDGDGFSPFLGGPDCDDTNPNVHPDAPEIPGNGIDDNCIGGDRALPADEPAQPDQPEVAADTAFRFEGNLVIIAVDTVRADRLGIAGYRRDGKSLTERLDAFAAGASYFTQAYSHAPNTPRAIPSMFGARYPSQIKVDKDFKNYPTVEEDNLLLFEVLQQAGFLTLGYSSHFYFNEERGIRQGFTVYDNEGALDIAGSNKDIASPRIVPKVEAKLDELAASKERFAMFVHLFEPHSTYVTHPEFPITERGVPGLVQKYDYEIAYVDGWIGRIFDKLEATGLADDTVVVIVSDHGEAFGVHRVAGKKMFFHGQTLYDELLRVPLILKVPGVEHRSITQPVGLIDVSPTILDVFGLPQPDAWVGRSLLPAMLGKELAPRPVFGELLPAPSWDQSAKMMVTGDGRHKIIYRISDKRFELYDLESDPDELTDLYRTQPELAAKLQDQLLEWMEVGSRK